MKGQNYYVDDDLKNNERNVLSSIYRTKHVFFAFLIKRFLGVVVHPLFDLKMKQIEWRKEKWQNAQKEESIGITLIR